ncbi:MULTISPECIES: hypothetical protein [Methylomonas]|uniref:Uncharacterized protein n=1 Tax=Methylomonas koyamae TaxID=702114 RepID=A0A177N4H7_9GAMM|nr:hypothetical protein [Methylomonas koyamae]OAI12755.1 hypothetical protein A1355_14030 [Methylomonas koyamae]
MNLKSFSFFKFPRREASFSTAAKILELAALKPATVAGALLNHPDIFRDLHESIATTLVLSLIDRGQADTLRQLLANKAIGEAKAQWLAELLLLEAFSE